MKHRLTRSFWISLFLLLCVVLPATQPRGVLAATLDPTAFTNSPFLKLLPSQPFYSPLMSPLPMPTAPDQTEGLKILKNQDHVAFISLLASAARDTTPPVTSINITGNHGFSDWYLGPVTVTLTATDDPNGSGVDHIEYAVNGSAFQTYTQPFQLTTPGVATVQYWALDKAGNKEAIQTQTLKMSTQAPEVVALFDFGTKNYEFTSASSHDLNVALSQSDTNITLQDAAGNATQLIYATQHTPHQAVLTITGLQYNQNPLTAVNATFIAMFRADTISNQTVPVFQKITIGDETVLAIYDPKYDQTLVERTNANQDSTTLVPGVALLKITSDNGTLVSGY